ncbi:MAG: hypothetical protein EP341_00665 [Sphingomonadales bacterium]|nr:MAG: hypothetical protein EP341_00665 [Sphingomonadales bacterium]
MNSAFRIEALGIVFITVTGSLLHFTYDFFEQAWWAGIFSAVNESVWEHLKLAFWPAMVWMTLSGPHLARRVSNFWLGKAVSISLMPLTIAVGFYAYTAAIGHHAFLWDMLLFVGAIVLGQANALVFYKLPYAGDVVAHIAAAILIIEAVAFATLTFFPLTAPLFSAP